MFIKRSTSLDPCLCLVCPCSSSIWLNIPCWGLHVEHYMFNKSLIWLISRTRSDRRSPIHQCLKILKCFIENSNYHNRIVYFLFSSHFHNWVFLFLTTFFYSGSYSPCIIIIWKFLGKIDRPIWRKGGVDQKTNHYEGRGTWWQEISHRNFSKSTGEKKCMALGKTKMKCVY